MNIVDIRRHLERHGVILGYCKVMIAVSSYVNEFICTTCGKNIRTLRWYPDSLKICHVCREKLGLMTDYEE